MQKQAVKIHNPYSKPYYEKRLFIFSRLNPGITVSVILWSELPAVKRMAPVRITSASRVLKVMLFILEGVFNSSKKQQDPACFANNLLSGRFS